MSGWGYSSITMTQICCHGENSRGPALLDLYFYYHLLRSNGKKLFLKGKLKNKNLQQRTKKA